MRTFILQPILLLLGLLTFPICGHSEIIVEPNTQLSLDKSCLTDGVNNLSIAYPNIAKDDAQYLTIYACFCAYNGSKKSSLAIEATDFRNVRNCIHYGVLRNAIRVTTQSSTEKSNNVETIKNACLASFPRDVRDDSMRADISNFCNCAAAPTEKIYKQIAPSKLNEEQIQEQLMTVINACRFSI